MSNYTTKTAALKATTIDTHLLDAKHITTKKILINGTSVEELIAANKGISNASKISTNIGSVLGTTVADGLYNISIIDGALKLQKENDTESWQPIQIIINDSVLMTQWSIIDNSWSCPLWDAEDDWTQLYGGLDENSIIEILMVIHEQEDGDEPVKNSLSGYVQHNVVYHLGEEANLNLTLPTSLVANYSAEVVFTSGTTPTVVTSDSRIKWVGDDVNAGVFTPVANVRYSCSLQYDGVFVRGMAFGIPTV